MVYRLTDSLLRDPSGTTKTTYALLGAIVVVAGVGAIGGAGSKLGERVAASDPAPVPATLTAVVEPIEQVEPVVMVEPVEDTSTVIQIASDTAPVPTETAPVAVLASAAPHVGSESRFAPAKADRPIPVAAARAEQARLDAIRDAVSIALATAAIERASEGPESTEAAWVPASGTLDIRPRSRPAD